MAVIYDVEGFDNMASVAAVWQAKGWDSNLTLIAGRLHGSAVRTTGNGPNNNYFRALLDCGSTFVLGLAFRTNVTTGSAGKVIFGLAYSSARVVSLTLDTSNRIVVSNPSTTAAIGTTQLAANTWYFVEIKIVIGASGSVTVRLDGNTTPEINTTTSNFGTSTPNQMYLFNGGGQAPTLDRDDIYVADDWLGDCEVYTSFATADSAANAEWTPDTGTVHYSRVNEVSGTWPDSDTSYVKSNTAGQRDTFVMGDTPASIGQVYGAVANLVARKDDSGTRGIVPVVREDSTNYDNATTKYLGASYAYHRWAYSLDGAGAEWSKASIDAAEFGVKVSV